ncbi:MAG: hypothetical protein JSS91_09105 [Bacteroidetes bacterium]|nr:hypothetical protein [Bacteroidota bacterium]
MKIKDIDAYDNFVFFISMIYCFLICLIILSIAEFKKNVIDINILKDVSMVLLKNFEEDTYRKKNDSHDFQKLYYKILLEFGKIKSKIEFLNNEIESLQIQIKKADYESEKINIKATIKTKNEEVIAYSKDLNEHQHNLNSIKDLLNQINN